MLVNDGLPALPPSGQHVRTTRDQGPQRRDWARTRRQYVGVLLRIVRDELLPFYRSHAADKDVLARAVQGRDGRGEGHHVAWEDAPGVQYAAALQSQQGHEEHPHEQALDSRLARSRRCVERGRHGSACAPYQGL